MRPLPAAFVVLALATPALAQVPAGGEFRVNTYTTATQNDARAAMEADGDFVVVWTSYGEDGSQFGVFGQRYAASGAPRGSEFQINTFTQGHQHQPAIAVGSRGDFVVAWTDGHNFSIHGRRYDAAGSAVGAEFVVNTVSPGFQYWPRVGRASDGRFVVSWVSFNGDGSSQAIVARRFDASGNPIGSEFVVNTYTTGIQWLGDIAVAANGGFVIVWEERSGDRDGSGPGIFGQRYDASGNRLGSEFLVNSYTTGRQGIPSISVSPTGGFVVAWTSQYGDGSAFGMFARRFDASGNAVGNDFVVNTYTTGLQYGLFGQVAHDARGNFVVTWQGPGDGSGDAASGQRFGAAGAPRGLEFRVNTYTTGRQSAPSVATDGVGNFVVAWNSADHQDGSGYGVFAQRFGGLWPFTVHVDTDPAGNDILEPGETANVKPTWENRTGSPQTFTAMLGPAGGPPNGIPQILDAFAAYGPIASGSGAQCNPCYRVQVPDPATRPAQHWDATALESIAPDTQGQQELWRLHIGRTFSDVQPASLFYVFVETVVHYDVTGGCSVTQYCPFASTTRAQMAVFVLAAKEGTGYVPPACGPTPMFADVVVSNPFCRWIEELARRGVVSGCGGGNYCPTTAVTREQMAVFVLRTLEPTIIPPACTTPFYNDVPASSPYCRWIEELTRRNVVSGCGGGNYCPAAAVTREQMAVFITRTFGLALYGP